MDDSRNRAAADRFIDPNLSAARKVLAEIIEAAFAVDGQDTIEPLLHSVDWNEKQIGTMLLFVDQVATTAAGAGAVANVDKAAEALRKVLLAIENGWHGAAADHAEAHITVIKNNLEIFKEELEQWARDVGADQVEQPASATQKLSAATGEIMKKADEIAHAHDHAATIVNAAVTDADRNTPEYQAAAREVIDARNGFTEFVRRTIGDYIGGPGDASATVYWLVAKHEAPLPQLRNPNYSTPVLVHSHHFGWSEQALIAAKLEAMTALANLRDAKNNLRKAAGARPEFGFNPGGQAAADAWQGVAARRIDDLSVNTGGSICLMEQVEELIRKLERVRENYREVENQTADQIDKILEYMYDRNAAAGKSVGDSVTTRQADAITNSDINYVLNGSWEGIPEGMPPEEIPPIEVLPPEQEPPSWREPGELPPDELPPGRR